MRLGHRGEKLDGISSAGVVPPSGGNARKQVLHRPALRLQDVRGLLFPVAGVGVDRVVVKAHCMHDVEERLQLPGQVDRDHEGVVTLREAIMANHKSYAVAAAQRFRYADVRLTGHRTTSSPRRSCASLPTRTSPTPAHPRPFGGTFALDALWRRLGIDTVLRGLDAGSGGRPRRGRPREVEVTERVLFGLVANRALAPSSKLAAADWITHDVHIDGLPETSDDACYRAMDWLHDVRDQLEAGVFRQVANLLNLEVDLLFFDTTSTYFELADPDEPVARDDHGHPLSDNPATPDDGKDDGKDDGESDGSEPGRVPDLRQVQGLP